MLRALEGITACELHVGAAPRSPDEPALASLPRAAYLSRLRSSVFALAPAGNNPETFRHWEALLQGAIPVAVRPPSDRSYLEVWCKNNNTNDADDDRWKQTLESDPHSSSQAKIEVKHIAEVADTKFDDQENEGGGGGNCPVVVLESWDMLPAFLARFSENAETPFAVSSEMAGVVDRMQRRALEWLHRFVNTTAHDVSDLIQQRL